MKKCRLSDWLKKIFSQSESLHFFRTLWKSLGWICSVWIKVTQIAWQITWVWWWFHQSSSWPDQCLPPSLSLHFLPENLSSHKKLKMVINILTIFCSKYIYMNYILLSQTNFDPCHRRSHNLLCCCLQILHSKTSLTWTIRISSLMVKL